MVGNYFGSQSCILLHILDVRGCTCFYCFLFWNYDWRGAVPTIAGKPLGGNKKKKRWKKKKKRRRQKRGGKRKEKRKKEKKSRNLFWVVIFRCISQPDSGPRCTASPSERPSPADTCTAPQTPTCGGPFGFPLQARLLGSQTQLWGEGKTGRSASRSPFGRLAAPSVCLLQTPIFVERKKNKNITFLSQITPQSAPAPRLCLQW